MLYHELTPVDNDDALLDILNAAGPIPRKPDDMDVIFPSSKSFIKNINRVAEYVYEHFFKGAPNVELIVAKKTGCSKYQHQRTNTECRPDLTLAPESCWKTPHKKWKKTLSWPWADLLGEIASAGDKNPLLKTLTHAHYWLLARPDRKVALSLLTTVDSVTFLVSLEGSTTTRTHKLDWGSPSLSNIVFALLYRLYDPGTWAKTEIQRKLVDESTLFDITINGETHENFRAIYAGNPFGMRTHVYANPEAEHLDRDELVTVIKDQLAPRTRRFVEEEIYKQIHGDGYVPGIARAHLFSTFENTPNEDRNHRITGLEECGSSIMEATTLRDVLEILFDALEVMRYLYVSRKVLHRDISKGNVLFSKTSTPPDSTKEAHPDLCFIGHLLDPENHPHPHETRLILIDFDNAEILDRKQDQERCLGTPIFAARAVAHGGPLPFHRICLVSEIPSAPDVYKTQHKQRVEKFPTTEHALLEKLPDDDDAKQWRHDLDHDGESVYWLLVYWLMAAQPIVPPARTKTQLCSQSRSVDFASWVFFVGDWEARNSYINGPVSSKAFHPIYKPLVSLIRQVGRIFAPDRHWLPKEDPRRHPIYAVEAFQRLILQFILDNQDAEFIDHKIDITRSRLPAHEKVVTRSCAMEVANPCEHRKRKRKASPGAKDITTSCKKPRHNAPSKAGPSEEGHDEECHAEEEEAPYTGPRPWEEYTKGQRIIMEENNNQEIVPELYDDLPVEQI